MLRYLESEFFSLPKTHPQGKGKRVRYFDQEWYETNEKTLKEAQEETAPKEIRKPVQDSAQ